MQMGVELEGGWFKSRKLIADKVRGAAAHDDRSVHIDASHHPGEIVTRPHESLDELLKDVEVLWPDVVNDSCGLHIHASFSPLNTSILATKEFYAYFKEQWAAWGKIMKLPKDHEFWVRLSGGKKFCKDIFEPEVQLGTSAASRGSEARYTMLNFHAWEKHKTLECRLLPMFSDREVGAESIRHMAWIYDSYLNARGFPTLSFETNAKLVGSQTLETYEIVMPRLDPYLRETEVTVPFIPTGPDQYYSIEGAMDLMLPHAPKTLNKTQA
jgi:hypothetical protein